VRTLAAGSAVSSFVLVAWPSAGMRAFSSLVYQDQRYPADFSSEALDYIRLTHAVLGAVMVGWFLTIFLLAPLAAVHIEVWWALVGGLVAWYVPDTAYSLLSGFWPNAVLNSGIGALFAPALAGLRPRRAEDGGVTSRAAAPRACP